MTLSPEARSRALLQTLVDMDDEIDSEAVAMEIIAARIATAIREAEDAALERATAAIKEAARPKTFGMVSVADELNLQAAAFFCERISALKHPKD